MFDELRCLVQRLIEEADAVSYAAGYDLACALDDMTRSGNDVINILIMNGRVDRYIDES